MINKLADVMLGVCIGCYMFMGLFMITDSCSDNNKWYNISNRDANNQPSYRCENGYSENHFTNDFTKQKLFYE